jgi:acetyl esterase/lipase
MELPALRVLTIREVARERILIVGGSGKARLKKPSRVSYGTGTEQWGEWWIPEEPGSGCPVALLVHGGFWRRPWSAKLMRRLARQVKDSGFIAFNVEYRRLGRFKKSPYWPAPLQDVLTVLERLPELWPNNFGFQPDWQRVVLIGHSAGGQLCLLAAKRWGGTRLPELTFSSTKKKASREERPTNHLAQEVQLSGVLAVAPLVDLRELATRPRQARRIRAVFRKIHAQEALAHASPLWLLPIGVPQFLIAGGKDRLVPVDKLQEYLARARDSGDSVTLMVEVHKGHIGLLRPTGAVISALDALVTAQGAPLAKERGHGKITEENDRSSPSS